MTDRERFFSACRAEGEPPYRLYSQWAYWLMLPASRRVPFWTDLMTDGDWKSLADFTDNEAGLRRHKRLAMEEYNRAWAAMERGV